MERVPMVAAINDMSGFGRCSLTVALPVLSAMGIQVCPLPTALLSNHTGYADCLFEDLTEQMDPYVEKWENLGLRFDGIYTGFLGNAAQVQKIIRFIEHFQEPGATLLVDPAMADDGSLYATCSETLCTEMRRLVSLGTVVTPNLTEACLLTDRDYNAVIRLQGQDLSDAVFELGEKIANTGPKQVVITGVPVKPETIANFVIDRTKAERFVLDLPRVERSYAGTGDVFASVLCGSLVRGEALRAAVNQAADFVRRVMVYSYEHRLPPLDGIAFEPFLHELRRDG